MDLSPARAARNSGAFDRALQLYRCVPAHQQFIAQREAYECLLDMATSRRVIGDLLDELGWEPTRYRGFAHLAAVALERADTSGLRDAFVALDVPPELAGSGAAPPDPRLPQDEPSLRFARAISAKELAQSSWDPAFRQLAGVSIADELVQSGQPIAQVLNELKDLGIPMSSGVRLAFARADMRAGRLEPAIDHLTSAAAENPPQVASWVELTRALLRQGRASAALSYGYVAAQLRRDRPNPYTEEASSIVLRYLGHAIVFAAGLFRAYRLDPPKEVERLGSVRVQLARMWHATRDLVRVIALRLVATAAPRETAAPPEADELLKLAGALVSKPLAGGESRTKREPESSTVVADHSASQGYLVEHGDEIRGELEVLRRDAR